MYAHSYKKTKRALSDTPNKNGTQQEMHTLIPFENNVDLQKRHRTNTSPELEKYDLTKIAHLAQKCPKVIYQGISLKIFKSKFLNLLCDSDSWSWDFKTEFFLLQINIPITVFCLMSNCRGVRFISRGLVVLQKNNNVSFEMPFL